MVNFPLKSAQACPLAAAYSLGTLAADAEFFD